MFAWFWEFLYGISKTIFRIIDALIHCANMLCGIEPITASGQKTDIMTHLLWSNEIGFVFKISALLATILVVIFAIFMILRSIVKDKAEGTPTQICIKAFKTLLTFFFVPAVIVAFITIGNTFLSALYKASIQDSASTGSFLFSVFAEDGGMSAENAMLFRTGEYDYTDTDTVWKYMELSDFPFMFSWLAGGVVLFGIGGSMLIFVDRLLSIVILYAVSPLSLSTCVLDDGSRFKLWRDQFLVKFITGYGMLLAINIYALVCSLVMGDSVKFSDSSFLDLIMKLLIIGGGALTMSKTTALIGNLISSGAGSAELRDNALSAGRLAGMASTVGKYTAGLPFTMGKSILGDAISMQSRHLGMRLLRGLHLDGGYQRKKTDKDGKPIPGSDDESDSKNNEKAKYSGNDDSTKKAINGGNEGFKQSFGSGNNDNSNNSKTQGNGNMLNNMINNTGNSNKNGGK